MTPDASAPPLLDPGSPTDLGACFDGNGTNFAVFSENATQIYLCLFSADGAREIARLPLPERTGPIWHGYLAGLRPGALYGLRADGPFDPQNGHRFNVNKLLIDPYARAFHGAFDDHETTFGYPAEGSKWDLGFDTRDSGPHMPKCVVPDPDRPATRPATARRGWGDALIYEAHVKGSTILHPGIAEPLRGTYEGLSSPAMLDHLQKLGVTAIELLPLQAIKSESALRHRGLVNYWGYNTIGFFAPEPRYFGPAGAQGFRQMVDGFHAAGIEVILDVVYNHSGEGDHMGPTLSFRGLDNAAYYRLNADDPRFYVNDTGCGNTLDTSHPFVMRMVLDSLRYWVTVMGIDGFRFDLATTLAREAHGFDPHGGFMDALRQDPVLRRVKLIAEPWDIGPGGYQLGGFTPEFAEWNDRSRDTVRRFWRGDKHGAQDLGSALLGSADIFDQNGRRAWSSVNFVAAHDGFTLADTTAYKQRHNHANGEQNRDGHHGNYSDNFGTEGDTTDPEILAARRLRRRNMLATVFAAQGTPMLLAGDEGGHSQQGNNNSYCQDNDISWIDWSTMDPAQIDFTAALSRFRRAHPVLRQLDFLHGEKRPSDGKPDVVWCAFDGEELDWHNPKLAQLCVHLRGTADNPRGDALRDEVLIAFNRTDTAHDVRLPAAPGRRWMRHIDTSRAAQAPIVIDAGESAVPAHSVSMFSLSDGTQT